MSEGTTPQSAEPAEPVVDAKEDNKMEKAETKAEKTPEKSDTPGGGALFAASFKAFSKFGDSKSDGKSISLSQSDKWMKQGKIFDKRISTTDTGITFKKQKAMKLTFEQYKTFIDDLAKYKKMDANELMNKMANCGTPGVSSNVSGPGSKASSTVGRLTDTSKYTGAHKQRFDESGKGKGMAGRKD